MPYGLALIAVAAQLAAHDQAMYDDPRRDAGNRLETARKTNIPSWAHCDHCKRETPHYGEMCAYTLINHEFAPRRLRDRRWDSYQREREAMQRAGYEWSIQRDQWVKRNGVGTVNGMGAGLQAAEVKATEEAQAAQAAPRAAGIQAD